MDSNQCAIQLVTYLLVLVVYFYELIVYMLLERNTFGSIAFFSQCTSGRKRLYLKGNLFNFFNMNIIFPNSPFYIDFSKKFYRSINYYHIHVCYFIVIENYFGHLLKKFSLPI